MKRLAIIVTHPIQYYVPVFQLLAKNISLKVFYTGGEHGFNQFDKNFGRHVSWDIPLLNGYNFEFLKNNAFKAGSHHFFGVMNKDAITQIKKYRPSAIMIYGWAYLSHLKLLRYFYGKTTILFRGDSRISSRLPKAKSLLKQIVLQWVYRHVNTALYVGSENRAYFENYGLKDIQLVFAPHAVDNNRFQQNRQQEAIALRTKLGILNDDIVVLFAGKLSAIKNPGILLKAFCQINPSKAHLIFVGSGELMQDLQDYANGQPVRSQVHFLSFQNQKQMPAIYQACDLFCMPTRYPGETWGLAVNEAMAAGKAILTSNEVASATDLVSESNGQIFKSENLQDLVAKLTIMLNNKGPLEIMGQHSKKKIAGWNIERQVQQILAYV